MKNLLVTTILFLSVYTIAYAQANDDFHAFHKQEKMLMLKSYAARDAAGSKKHMDNVLAKYNKLNEKDKQNNRPYIQMDYYLLASTYAVANDKNNALIYLEKADDDDYDELIHDKDFVGLRKEPRFIAILNKAKSLHSEKLTVLRKAAKYNNEKTGIPPFIYQPASNPNLAALRKAYNLDSVAGGGNDVSRIINLMEWVHYLIPHDGSKNNPDTKNAMSFIRECKKDNKTLNCRGLGILLNEVYLAEGFKSRYVTCLPYDITDQDCHVITMVWSASLNKWLWMDPTFMAYVMDNEGTPLSIEEVRDRLINNKPLLLNPDANRNHETSQDIGWYLGYYMAKNLYRLQCPVSSEYDYETKGDGKTRSYIELTPGDKKPAPQVEKDKHGVSNYTEYYTSNAREFWAAPPADPTPVASVGTTDYEYVMEQFKSNYNNKAADNIVDMFSNPKWAKSVFNSKYMDELTNRFGKMVSYKYLAQEDGSDVALFKMVFDKSVHVMGISIDKDRKLETYRFETSSPYIDKLLAKEL